MSKCLNTELQLDSVGDWVRSVLNIWNLGEHYIFYGLINPLGMGVTTSYNSSIIVFNLSYFLLNNSYFI